MKEKLEDTRIRKSKKNRQHNGQQKKTEEQTTQRPTEKDRRTDNTMIYGFWYLQASLS
jgi:hypothetical protein